MNIVFCTTVKNRTQHLRETLPRSLESNPNSKFVILDYNTQDDLFDFLQEEMFPYIISGRLVAYSHPDEPTFRMAHAKNMAHRCGILEGGDILVNLDADNTAAPGFEDYIAYEFKHNKNCLLWSRMVKGEMPRGVSGRIVVSKQAFLKVGGYDEHKFNEWGSDDKDFNLRLQMIGQERVEIPREHLLGISHNNKIRFKEYPHLISTADEYFEVSKATAPNAVVNSGRFGCGIVYRNQDFSRPIILRPLPTRIFGIGLHKTATTSLHHAFETLGYDSWHWSSAHAAKAIWRETNNLSYSPTLERYQALCDLPIPILYEQLDGAYPNSKFILTVRDEQQWLDAVERHFDPLRNKWVPGWNQDPFTHRIHNLLYGQRDFDPKVFLARYRQHNLEVNKYFRYRSEDLLTMHMDRGAGWPELCGFLDLPIPTSPYPQANNSRE